MKWCITLCGPSRELPQKNQSIHVEIQNKCFFWHVLGLFRLFLACSWIVQVVLGLFRGVPSFSNDALPTQKLTTLPLNQLKYPPKRWKLFHELS